MIRLILAAACLSLELVGAATAQQSSSHIVMNPGAIEWKDGPVALPAGAKSALLYGDPGKPELFVLRLWLPKGYRVAPHTHPRPEVVTVISGGGTLGYGKDADGASTHRMAAGSLMVTPANAPHHASFDEDTILQLNTTRPWAVTYVNPADDPRNKAR